jgi:hypothetical protein
MESFEFSFVRPDGTEFLLVAPYDIAEVPDDTLDHDITSGNTEGRDGEYQADSNLAPRTVTLRGNLQAAGPSQMQTRLDTLYAAFPKGGEGKFYRRIRDLDTMAVVSSRFLSCRVSSRSPGARDGMPQVDWTFRLRAADPRYYDETLQAAVTLNVSGSVAVTPGGTEAARPLLTLVVSVVGTIRVLVEGAVVFAFVPDATGTYILDMEAQTFTKGGVDKLTTITEGGFFELPTTESDITFTYADGGALTSASIQWRRAWGSA